jgi:hypothetical protein
MLKALDDLIESRIRDAHERGAFDDLPGAGRPLPEEDLVGVPQDLRVAYRILRNAGCVPPEIDALRDVDALIARAGRELRGPAEATRARAGRRLLALTLALEARGLGPAAGALLQHREALLRRLGERDPAPDGGPAGRAAAVPAAASAGGAPPAGPGR